jgi:hypothetical protein
MTALVYDTTCGNTWDEFLACQHDADQQEIQLYALLDCEYALLRDCYFSRVMNKVATNARPICTYLMDQYVLAPIGQARNTRRFGARFEAWDLSRMAALIQDAKTLKIKHMDVLELCDTRLRATELFNLWEQNVNTLARLVLLVQ